MTRKLHETVITEQNSAVIGPHRRQTNFSLLAHSSPMNVLIACGIWMRFWMSFSARMDTSLKMRILKSIRLKLNMSNVH